MLPVKSFVVRASLPKQLEALRDLSSNLGWYWNAQVVKLFYRLDRNLWEEKYHNPVAIIGSIPQASLEVLSKNEGIIAHIERVKEQYDKYLYGSTWYSNQFGKTEEKKIAYFSLEFGMSESVPIYSGGLGILAGDHLKSASDLGLPLAGVGLLYQEGYFRQYLNKDGWQQELYIDNDFYNMPVHPVLDNNGNELRIELDFPLGPVYSKIWRIDVGRVPLFLLDTNIPENTPENRKITGTLYGGDQEMRLKQELLLGIGGIRALYAMGIRPQVCHMNEGHAAFLALERIRELMDSEDLTFDEAFELASSGNVFTTHTPVAAGHDRFSPELMQRYFANFYPELGLTIEEFLGLGRINTKSATETFCMTVLALKTADKSNAVSALHGKVSQEMWKSLWPGLPLNEVPISHITNGIHISSWISHDMVDLFDRYLGPRWKTEPYSEEIWDNVKDIPDEEIWRTHEVRRERLVTFARKRLQAQLKRQGASTQEIDLARGILNSKVLTICFARRFATYKRADLLFRNVERLSKILKNPDMPVQIIIAGKAHPRDDEGKEIIRKIVHLASQPNLKGSVIFIEDYDMNAARYLVQGADIWLNTPKRPLEASGTSGMKAAANGALNLSILDGWWDEAYTPDVGWAIGSGELYGDSVYQDEIESNAMYNLLENEIVPLYYRLGEGGIPRRWIEKMKNSLSALVPVYNTHRMVHEYLKDCYHPAMQRFEKLNSNNASGARTLALWRHKIRENWGDVKVVNINSDNGEPFEVGGSIKVNSLIKLGKLAPEDVRVELFCGLVDASGSLVDALPIPMRCVSNESEGYKFEGVMPFDKSGKLGFSLRVIPYNPDEAFYQEHMLVKWA